MRNKLIVVAVAFGLLIAAVYGAYQLSPRPMVVLIRYVFAKGAERVSASAEPFLPVDVSITRGLRYGPGLDERFDVFIPRAANSTLPAVLWVHGGGFVAGSREDLTNYLQVLASRGFVAIAIDYSLAPDARFPTPVRQTNRALAHIVANAEHFHIDTQRLFLAGDSAGAHIAAQSALVISDPSYATRIGVEPGVPRERIRGVVLFCGPFDPIGRSPEWLYAPYVRTVVWSYMGTRNLEDAHVTQLAVVPHVSRTFPPTFISAGNVDPLAPQAVALADALRAKGVQVETLFFPDNHDSPVGHEYQLMLSKPEAWLALERYVAFMKSL